MRIVDVNGFYAAAGGGVRRYVEAKFAAADLAGHDLTVVAPGESSRLEERPGGRVRWIASPPMPFDRRYRRFDAPRAVWSAIDAAGPDIVEASSPWASASLVSGWEGKAARALVFHQDFVAAYAHTSLDWALPRHAIDALAGPWWARLRALARRFDVTVAGGDWLARRLADHGVANAWPAPFGVEAGVFSPGLRDRTLRAEMLDTCDLPPRATLLIAMSRFHPEKRLPTVIRAVALARRHRRAIGLAVIGDGLARPAIERAAARAGGVTLLGSVDSRAEVARRLASADLFLHGSGAETYGLATAEAIVSGLPVVAPGVGGAADLARRGRSRTYRAGDPADAARAILDALAGRLDEPTAPPPQTLGAHFTGLFGLYERLRSAGGASE